MYSLFIRPTTMPSPPRAVELPPAPAGRPPGSPRPSPSSTMPGSFAHDRSESKSTKALMTALVIRPERLCARHQRASSAIMKKNLGELHLRAFKNFARLLIVLLWLQDLTMSERNRPRRQIARAKPSFGICGQNPSRMKKETLHIPGISKADRQTGQTRLRSIQRRRAERCGKREQQVALAAHVQRGSAAQNRARRSSPATSAALIQRAASMPDQ